MARTIKKTAKKRTVARKRVVHSSAKKKGFNISKIFELWFVVPQ